MIGAVLLGHPANLPEGLLDADRASAPKPSACANARRLRVGVGEYKVVHLMREWLTRDGDTQIREVSKNRLCALAGSVNLFKDHYALRPLEALSQTLLLQARDERKMYPFGRRRWRREHEIVCANRKTHPVWRTTSMDATSVLWTRLAGASQRAIDRNAWSSKENAGLLRAGHRLARQCCVATKRRNRV